MNCTHSNGHDGDFRCNDCSEEIFACLHCDRWRLLYDDMAHTRYRRQISPVCEDCARIIAREESLELIDYRDDDGNLCTYNPQEDDPQEDDPQEEERAEWKQEGF